MELNLTANGKPQELILAYLQANVSETLAEKINNGVLIEKEGKRLLNKKTLDGFMKYANGEAKKLAEKGANSACVEDAVVYGWAIHYFEEDSIEGKLYNEDGTEYKAPAPVKTTTATTYTPPKPAPKPQISMFDLISSDSNADEEPDELTDEELEEEPAPVVEQPKPVQKKGSAMYQHYLSIKEKHKDCIVFYRLGDFYEMFGEDAKIASDILNLTLTGRDVGLDERVPMTGIPYHAVDNCISKLVSKNYKIAVCEQLSGDVDRVIAKQPDSQIVDIKSGEILKDEKPTVSKVTAEVDSEEPSDDLDLSHIDKETMLILYELLDGNLDIQ